MRLLVRLFAIALLTLLAGCGGDNATTPIDRMPENIAPIANAGSDQNVDEETQINITGSGTDADGTIAAYKWIQTSGISAILSNENTSTLSVLTPTAVQVETLEFKLTVTDNQGLSASDLMSITVNPVNNAPTVDAGLDQASPEKAMVNLNALANDSDGTISAYSWTQTSGTTVNLENADSVNASFIAPDLAAGSESMILSFSILVTDNDGLIAADSVNITVTAGRIAEAITTSRTSCIAPCGIMFDATQTTSLDFSEPFHQLNYRWNYGDPGSTFIQRPDVDANKSTSPLGAHVFETPGSYQVQLTVTDMNAQVTTAVVSITVQDPELAYAELTYCVSNTGAFGDCPTQEESFHIASFDLAMETLIGLRFTQNSRPTRFLFKAGEVFQPKNIYTIRDTTGPILISRFGSGADPVISTEDSIQNGGLLTFMFSDAVTVSAMEFKGNYDPTTGIGSHPSPLFFYLGTSNTTIFQNKFSGLGLNLYMHGGSDSGVDSQFQMVVDNQISDWQDYGIYGDFGYLSTVLANSIKQNVNAVSGAEGRCGDCIPNFPDHGPLRTPVPDHFLVQSNTMFSNTGWSSSGLGHQPTIRIGTLGETIKSIVTDNILEGGFNVLSMQPSNSGLAGGFGETIIERNSLKASSNTEYAADIGLGGVVIRNNLFLKPDNDGPPIGTGTLKSAIIFRSLNLAPASVELTNHIYNNSLISTAQVSAPNLTLLDVDNNFEKFELHNNLLYMPFVNENSAGLLSWNYSGSISSVNSDNNLVYMPEVDNYITNNSVSTSLVNWQQSGNDLLSFLSDPLLSEPDNFNAKLTEFSPAINTGLKLDGVFTDFEDKSRDSNIDIGAYEF